MHVTEPTKLILAVALLWTTASPKPPAYRNEEFGITVPVPDGALLCVYADQHDHGPLMLLGTSDPAHCRNDIEHNRYIDIFASYLTDDTKRLDSFLRSECEGIAGAPCGPPPSGLHITGLRSRAARVNRPDGWIYVLVVTQAGKPDPAFDPRVPSVNYDVSLHTTTEHFQEDLQRFRALLQTVRLSPPPPQSAAAPKSPTGQQEKRPITAQEVAALKKAILDEIYDWGYEKDYTNIGTTGAIDEPTDVTIFIYPEIDENGWGGAMYRLMPFGEVVRRIWFRPDGTAILWGNPWNGFPASQPDTRTIYLDDDWVCAYKRKAIRATFTVDPNVSRARRQAAVERQIIRVGHSHFLETRPAKTSRKKARHSGF